ncbi:hypothetical protein AWV80_14915 [Cupriavidus sp. UYMU48A]|nr:hypothetical protein AWV80_14915 [Cupriavidus sp. UYMU48A]
MKKMNLTESERDQLQAATRSRTVRAADARRAKLILLLDEGASREAIMQRLGCDSRFISRWSSRFWPSDCPACTRATLDERRCSRPRNSKRAC